MTDALTKAINIEKFNKSTFRNVCFTLNNYTDEEYQALLTANHKYIVIGKEVGDQGTPHLQGYMEFGRSVTGKYLMKLCKNCHYERRYATAVQASNYCKEDGDFVEIGEMSKQGERGDLNLIKQSIVDGARVDDIAMDKPIIYHQYGRTLNKIEDIAMRKRYRSEMTKGLWLYGPTNVGKSHEAFANYDPSTHYMLPISDKGWWDGYTQQATVIINDFRGEIPYNELLNLVDKWPYSVRRRNREPMPFTSKMLIVTSSLPPGRVYHNRNDEDALDQLLRRFEVKHVEKMAEVPGGVIVNPPPPFPLPSPPILYVSPPARPSAETSGTTGPAARCRDINPVMRKLLALKRGPHSYLSPN